MGLVFLVKILEKIMTAILKKSQVIKIFSDAKSNDTSYTLGVNWGKIEMQKRNFLGIKTKKDRLDIDLDLTCVMFDAQKKQSTGFILRNTTAGLFTIISL